MKSQDVCPLAQTVPPLGPHESLQGISLIGLLFLVCKVGWQCLESVSVCESSVADDLGAGLSQRKAWGGGAAGRQRWNGGPGGLGKAVEVGGAGFESSEEIPLPGLGKGRSGASVKRPQGLRCTWNQV